MDEKTCGCATPAAETVSEPIEAVYEDSFEALESYPFSPTCIPWIKVTKDPERFRKCAAQSRARGPLKRSRDVYELLKDDLVAEDQEVFCVILLDTQLQLRGVAQIAKGARDRTLAPIPDILRVAIVAGATAFIVVHNHPSGKSNPSAADKALTKDIQRGAATIGIPLFDHVVFGSHDYFSFADHNLISK